MPDPNALLPSSQLYDVNGKLLFSIERNFSKRTYQNVPWEIKTEIVDPPVVRAEALVVEQEGGCKRARYADRANYLHGIKFPLREASNKTIVRPAKDARRVP